MSALDMKYNESEWNKLQEKRPSIIKHNADEGKDKIQARWNGGMSKGGLGYDSGEYLHQIQSVGGDDATKQSRTTALKTLAYLYNSKKKYPQTKHHWTS